MEGNNENHRLDDPSTLLFVFFFHNPTPPTPLDFLFFVFVFVFVFCFCFSATQPQPKVCAHQKHTETKNTTNTTDKIHTNTILGTRHARFFLPKIKKIPFLP